MTPSPFHTGETYAQQQAGVGDDPEASARQSIRGYLPEQHRAFHTSLPFIIAAARDDQGQPWATILAGPEGFVTSPDPRTLLIDTSVFSGDALDGALGADVDLGLLGIELASRRRNRVNGRVKRHDSGAITLAVDQTFGNCPQYIRQREWRHVVQSSPGTPRRGCRLTADQCRWITSADTFFIASGYRGEGESPMFGMDASHRGGEPGFVQVENNRHLVFPDYAGNHYFNTLGNLVLDPRAGLLFVDFEQGSLLQLAVRTTIDWHSSAVAAFPGARRLIHCEIDAVVELLMVLPLRWEAGGSPVRALRLVSKTTESDDVTSFVFAARDGGQLPPFQAGQHLPLELKVPGQTQSVRRTYSLSNGPSKERYRISVKRGPDGLASSHLHDNVDVGAIINANAPAGDFVLAGNHAPIVLISAGIGVTPMISMLESLAETGDDRPVLFIHGARDGRHHPLAQEVRDAAARRTGIQTHVAYSRPRPEDRLGLDYDSAGRVDGPLIASLIVDNEAEYYVCGPVRFMADIQNGLETSGVAADRVHTESFGPASRAGNR
ncbi:FAD-binding oxidoreductase [Salinisphaera aquimarina]|uniref:FAD-binding oxidoreductase n=1 Tax=Salinisphaera aquimarina TaxID=2094031 RepID=A0ABV7EUW7_9GAMM